MTPNLNKFINQYDKWQRYARSITRDEILAEDILHETWLFFKFNDYAEVSFDNYFYSAIKGRFLNHKRDKHLNPDRNIELQDFMLGAEDQRLLKPLEQEQFEQVTATADRLFKKNSPRSNVIKGILEGKDFTQIAKDLNQPYNTIKATYRQALNKIKGEIHGTNPIIKRGRKWGRP